VTAVGCDSATRCRVPHGSSVLARDVEAEGLDVEVEGGGFAEVGGGSGRRG